MFCRHIYAFRVGGSNTYLLTRVRNRTFFNLENFAKIFGQHPPLIGNEIKIQAIITYKREEENKINAAINISPNVFNKSIEIYIIFQARSYFDKHF